MSAGILRRKFRLTVMTAKSLPSARTPESKNKIQAKVTLMEGDKITEKHSLADKQNGLNPCWYYKFDYDIPESNIMDGRLVVIKLYSHRKLKDDIYIGESQTSIKCLFDLSSKGSTTLALPVKNGEVETGGVLNISYGFSTETFVIVPPSKRKAVWKGTKKVSKVAANVVLIGAIGFGPSLASASTEDDSGEATEEM